MRYGKCLRILVGGGWGRGGSEARDGGKPVAGGGGDKTPLNHTPNTAHVRQVYANLECLGITPPETHANLGYPGEGEGCLEKRPWQLGTSRFARDKATEICSALEVILAIGISRCARDKATPPTSPLTPGPSSGPGLPVRARRHAARPIWLQAGAARESPSWSSRSRPAQSRRAGTSS
jgi:hypothetical protein